ncbi:glycosyltransferase family 2 protein [Opitutus terrae]|uniref:Glycosyl transferase family 2 n=1 Tax=Opitutus terrae (strain DSM 11246 / JCM 15787 / PB90-1) TaxID=452637 RepID=B1ZV67_OPITP|nr:glycosyltransferase [Opitutus terrae]ACB76734.1 glycosyl transferase family 2 [Opitutus terrae PB90-1]
MDKLLSIVIAAYNVEPWVDDCLLSIESQRDDRLDVVIVDDGSTDGTSDVIRAHKKRWALQCVTKKNGGLSSARNAGASAAGGRYLWFIDADDMILPGAVACMIAQCEQQRFDAIVFGTEEIMEGHRVPHRPRPIVGTPLESYLAGHLRFAVWNKILRAEIVNNHRIRFPIGCSMEGISFLGAFFLHASNVKVVPDICYAYRIRPGSIVTSASERILSDTRLALTELEKELVDHASERGTRRGLARCASALWAVRIAEVMRWPTERRRAGLACIWVLGKQDLSRIGCALIALDMVVWRKTVRAIAMAYKIVVGI